MATTTSKVLLKITGDGTQLNKTINEAIKNVQKLANVAAKATSPATTGATSGGGLLSGISKEFSGAQGLIDKALKGLDKSVMNVSRTFNTLQRSIASVGDAMRLTSQAVSTLGRVWTFLISAPLGLFFKQQAQLAIEFEDVLVRVQKVTNFTTAEIRELRDALREVAINTSTSHQELAQIAEVIGQAGIKSKQTIIEMTETINMFSIATSIAADEAATDLIRIGNAFGWTQEMMSTNAKKMGSVFNMLENTNAVTAEQVMRGTAEWAQQAKALNIAESAAAAYTATLVAMGLSESEAGTAMKRFTSGLIQNIDEVVNAMEGIQGYSSAREVANAIDEDAVQVINDIVMAAEAGNSAALKLADSLEIGGVRGGRAIVALANNTALLNRNLAASKREWDSGTSLIQEYELAMTSTKNQMALLRNNINDVGITIGDALLPTINQLIMIIVPAIRMFNEWMRTLDDSKKRMIVLGAIGAIALGPLLFMLGQVINSLSLMWLGFGRLLLLIPNLYTVFVSLLKPILLFGKIVLGWPGLIVVAVAGILKVLSKMGADVAGFFIDLGERAVAWGERLAQTYASGFLSGAVQYIAQAIQWVANMIASFFKGSSPPKTGPLSTIDKWGSKVMEAYLDGFKKADFGVLSSVGKLIEKELSRGLEGKELANALARTAEARMNLAKLMEQFNKTGNINKKLLSDITDGLGPLTDNVKALITHWMEYNRLQEKIAEIEAKRKGVKKSYYDELKAIAKTNMSMQDKVSAIREAQRARDDDLSGLTKEQEYYEEQADKEKEKYEYQQQMIGAMQEQDDLLQRMVDTLKALAEQLKGGMGADDLGGGFGELPDPSTFTEGLLDGVNTAMDTLESRLNRGKQIFQGLLDGWFGNENSMDQLLANPHARREQQKNGPLVDDEAIGLYDTLYSIGERAREVYTTIQTWVGAVIETASTMKSELLTTIEDIRKAMASTDEGGGGGMEKIADAFERVKEALAPVVTYLTPLVELLGTKFNEVLSTLGTAWGIIVDAFKSGGIDIGAIFTFIGAILGFIAGLVTTVVSALLTGLQGLILGVATVIGGIIKFILGTLSLLGNGIKMWGAIFRGDWDAVKEYFQAGLQSWKTAISGIWDAILGVIMGAVATIGGLIVGLVEGIVAWFKALWYTLVGGSIIPDMVNGIITWISTLVTSLLEKAQEIFDSWKENWENLKETVVELAQGVAEDVQDAVQVLLDWFSGLPETMLGYGKALIQGLWDGITEIWDGLKAWAEENFGWLIDLIAKASKQSSPSKVTEQQGIYLMEGLANGLRQGMKSVKDLMVPFSNSFASDGIVNTTSLTPTMIPVSSGAGNQIIININDPVVRDDSDIDEIVRQVKRVLQNDVRQQQAFGGYIR